LVISRTDFYHLVATLPEFAVRYREILELGFITAQKRIYGFQGFDALEKVKWIITNQKHFLLRVSNKMAASYFRNSSFYFKQNKTDPKSPFLLYFCTGRI